MKIISHQNIYAIVLFMMGICGLKVHAALGPSVLPVNEAFHLDAFVEKNQIRVTFEVTPGYYLYKSQMSFKSLSKGYKITQVDMPAGMEKYDIFAKRQTTVYPNNIQVLLHMQSHPKGPINLKIGYQGCASAGVCYPPQRVVRTVSRQSVKSTKLLIDTPMDATVLSKKVPVFVQNLHVAKTLSPIPFAQQKTSAHPHDQVTALSLKAPIAKTGQSAFLVRSAQEKTAPNDDFSRILTEHHLFWSLVLFLIAGVGLSFTPCVLPMIPIVSAMIVGNANTKKKKAFALSCCYVLAMALTYALIGTLVGSFGARVNIQAMLQSPLILTIFAAIFALLALHLFGVLQLRLPAFLRQKMPNLNISGGSYVGAILLGIGSSLVVSPCVSAPLAGVLIYISSTENALFGALALFALGLGMGAPLLVIGASAKQLLPRAGAWMERISTLFGIALLAVAISLLSRVLTDTWIFLLWGVLLICAGIWMGALRRLEGGWPLFWQGLGFAVLVWGVFFLVGAASGHRNAWLPLQSLTGVLQSRSEVPQQAFFKKITTPRELQQELAQAKQAHKAVLLDFYANWCVACKMMDKDVFPQQEVQKLLQDFHLVRLNITDNTEAQQKLLTHFGVFGPPSIVFFDKQGHWLKAATIQGEVTGVQLTQYLTRALAQQ